DCKQDAGRGGVKPYHAACAGSGLDHDSTQADERTGDDVYGLTNHWSKSRNSNYRKRRLSSLRGLWQPRSFHERPLCPLTLASDHAPKSRFLTRLKIVFKFSR